MPAPVRPISREYRIYLALWRKAMTSSEPVVIQIPSLHMGIAMRQGMYRAIRPFREGALEDKQLRDAAEKFVIYLERQKDKDEPHFIEFRERKALALLEADLGLLGIDEEDLLIGEERKIHDKLAALIDEPEEAPRSTPFYERD